MMMILKKKEREMISIATETETEKEAESEPLKNDNNNDKTKEKEKDSEKIPDFGGTKRLNKEYANKFKCIFYCAILMSVLNGALWPVAYGWFFRNYCYIK